MGESAGVTSSATTHRDMPPLACRSLPCGQESDIADPEREFLEPVLALRVNSMEGTAAWQRYGGAATAIVVPCRRSLCVFAPSPR